MVSQYFGVIMKGTLYFQFIIYSCLYNKYDCYNTLYGPPETILLYSVVGLLSHSCNQLDVEGSIPNQTFTPLLYPLLWRCSVFVFSVTRPPPPPYCTFNISHMNTIHNVDLTPPPTAPTVVRPGCLKVLCQPTHLTALIKYFLYSSIWRSALNPHAYHEWALREALYTTIK